MNPTPASAANRFAIFQRNWFITLSMVASIIWCVLHYPPPRTDTFAASTLIFLASAFACLLMLLLLQDNPARTGILSAIILFGFSLIGVFGTPHELSHLIPIGDHDFVRTNREKWEVVALLSTAFMALIYWDSLDEIREGYQGRPGQMPMIFSLLLASVVMIVVAMLQLHDLQNHYILVLGVTILFSAIDAVIWLTLRGSRDERFRSYANDTRALLFILDIPVCIGLVVLSGFLLSLHCDPTVLQTSPQSMENYEAMYQNACVEAFPFMAGALAFQMISFNVIYVFFSLRLHVAIQHRLEEVIAPAE